MAQIKLDIAEIEESFGPLETIANSNIVELINSLADALRDSKDEDPMAAELWDVCRKAQEIYNDGYLPSLKDMIELYKQNIDLAEYNQKKASTIIGSDGLSTADTGFKAEKLPPEAIGM